jgi:tRNA(fMet)-specific endonuclease VapC
VHLLDTSVLIPLRDGDMKVVKALAALKSGMAMSAISLVELEGGVARDLDGGPRKRALVDELLSGIQLLPFGEAEARAYGRIAVAAGYSRRKLIDRMIAAQALVAEMPLVTLNPADFSDVPGLRIVALPLTIATRP